MSENATAESAQTEPRLSTYTAETLGFPTEDTTLAGKTATNLPAYLAKTLGVFTEDDYLRLVYAVKMAVAPILLMGITTNTLAILVYLRMPSSVTSTYFCLASGLDIIYLVSVAPTVFISLVLDEEAARVAFYIYYVTYVSNYVTPALRKVIVCVTMMMSVDRYLVIAFPVRIRALEHLRRPRLYTLLVAIIVFALDVNLVFKNKVIVTSTLDAAGHQVNTIRIVPTTAFLENSQLFLDLALTASVLFLYAPLCLLALFNNLLVVSLARHSRDMKRRFGGAESGSNRQMPTFGSISKQDGDAGDSNVVSYPDQNVSKYTNQKTTRKLKGSTSDNQQKAVTRTVMSYSFLFILLALPHTFYPLVRRFVPGLEVFQRGLWPFAMCSLYWTRSARP